MALKAKISAPELLPEAVEKHGRFMTLPDACDFLTVSSRTIKRIIAAGDLPCYTIGRTRAYRVKTEDVVALVRQVA